MARNVSFTHPQNGTVYTNAYCELNVVDINKKQRKAYCRFDVYATKAAYDAEAVPVHSSGFTVEKEEFVAAMTAETLKQKNVAEIAYEHAATKLRVNPNDAESALLFEGSTEAT